MNHTHNWNDLMINFRGPDYLQACLVPGCDRERRWRYRNGRLRLRRGRTGKPVVSKILPLELVLNR